MLIKVKVFPHFKENQIIKKSSDSYVIKVKESAKNGRANLSVKMMLANYFNISPGKIKLLKGGKRPNKIFEIVTK